MACYRPVSIGRKPGSAYEDNIVPCGRCLGCLLRRARDWTVRCAHELALHDDAMFLTLTFSDEHLPLPYLPVVSPYHYGTLRKDILQLFLKRYRKHLKKRRISFFACGEYGRRFSRPHYHAIIFGHKFPDLVPHSIRNGHQLWHSPTLTQLWGLGEVIVGDVTPESIAYVARYTIDKLYAKISDPEYLATGRIPEYVTMSRRPAIGLDFYRKYYAQFLATDSAWLNGFRHTLPRYYDKLYDRYFGYLDSSDFVFGRDSILDVDLRTLNYSPEVIKARRISDAALRFLDSLPDRLSAREAVARARFKQRPTELH